MGETLPEPVDADFEIGRRPVTWEGGKEGIRCQPAVDLGVHTLFAQSNVAQSLDGHCRLHAPAPGLLCPVHLYPTFPARGTNYGQMDQTKVDQVTGDADRLTVYLVSPYIHHTNTSPEGR